MREGTEQALDAAQKMAEHPEGWLILKGKRGSGKTHLLKAITEAWGFPMRFWPWQTSRLLDFWRSGYEDGTFQETFEAHCTASRFPLDDLGAERPTRWAVERLTMFLDYRYGYKLPTVITTNLNEEEMAKQLGEGGERIVDRVFDRGSGLCNIVTLTCPSYRTGKVW